MPNGDIALGYGSKWHLLRYMGWHRHYLNALAVSCVPNASKIEWLDQKFTGNAGEDEAQDAELRHLEFLHAEPVQESWRDFWPQTGKKINWDAVGFATVVGGAEWVLVEAKANLDELKSSCGATNPASLELINQSLNETKQAMGVAQQADWLNGYYQYANRLAVLHFLLREGIRAHLLFIYFYGDRPGMGPNWPQTQQEWEPALTAMEGHLGLPPNHNYSDFIHKLFLPVAGP